LYAASFLRLIWDKGYDKDDDDDDDDDNKHVIMRPTVTSRTLSSKSGSPGSASRPHARLALRLVLSTGLRNRVRKFSKKKEK
jgi:hypothetical protein